MEALVPDLDSEICPVCEEEKPPAGFWSHVESCAAELRRERDEAIGRQLGPTIICGVESQPPALTAGQKTAAREEMKAQGGPCPHCGGLHSRACPRVRRVKWDGGKPVEAVYWRDGKWPTDSILFPDDIAEDEEDTP